MRSETSFGDIVAALDRHGVRYVLIGGLAAVAHGSPFPTEDIDITPEAAEHNLAQLSKALTELHAKVRAEGVDEGLPFSHDAGSLASANIWNLVTAYGDLDISLVPSGTRGFPDLVREAEVTTIYGTPVLIASLADVIRSKQAANRPKDQRVLPVLREIQASRCERPRD